MYTYFKTHKYEYVDLGLPSGTLWATCNIGASTPSDSGLYFAYGDVHGYSKNQIGQGNGQKWFSHSEYSDWEKNHSDLKDSTILKPQNDAAHINMGGDWHIPTIIQVRELFDYTINTWTTLNEVGGMKFISKQDNSKYIFIPACGDAEYGHIYENGYITSATQDEYQYSLGYKFSPTGIILGYYEYDAYNQQKVFGCTIRGVISPKTSNRVHKTNGHEFVDLGLTSGTLWATCNVGAQKPTDAGLYFQWGDTVGYPNEQIVKDYGKDIFTWDHYKWSINGSNTNFSKYTTKGQVLDLEDDAAHVHMGGDWHMPTPQQIEELYRETTISDTEVEMTISGIKAGTLLCLIFTSKKDPTKSLMIPKVAGNGFSFNKYGLDSNPSYGTTGTDDSYLWSSRLSNDSISKSYVAYNANYSNGYTRNRMYGQQVRGVIG